MMEHAVRVFGSSLILHNPEWRGYEEVHVGIVLTFRVLMNKDPCGYPFRRRLKGITRGAARGEVEAGSRK